MKPFPIAALWTTYEGDDPEECLDCGLPVVKGADVRVYAEGLVHAACWTLRNVPDSGGPGER